MLYLGGEDYHRVFSIAMEGRSRTIRPRVCFSCIYSLVEVVFIPREVQRCLDGLKVAQDTTAASLQGLALDEDL
jgi:hypothetical protein